MSTMNKALSLMALVCAAGAAMAQQQASPPAATPASTPSAKATALSEAGEPRADTSGPTATAPAPAAPSAAPAAPTTPAAPSAAARTPAGHATPGTGPAVSAQKSTPKIDRLDLGTATVTGDREQPKVMYIVPWKRSDIGDLAGRPMNSLVDEILAPVDRDVFKREVVYYHAVQSVASQNGAPPKPAQQGEK